MNFMQFCCPYLNLTRSVYSVRSVYNGGSKFLRVVRKTKRNSPSPTFDNTMGQLLDTSLKLISER